MTRVRSWMVIGMALLLGAAVASPAAAQARRGGGMRSSLLGLLRLEAVQKELKLDEDTIGKVSEVGEKLREEMRDQWSGLRDLDAQQRMAKFRELGDQYDQKAREQLRDVLSREQIIRLYRIRLQVRAVADSLTNQYVARLLELTDEQKEKVAKLQKASWEEMFAAFRTMSDLSQEERREKFVKMRGEADKKALELLNDDQKEAFEKMKGEKLEL